MRSGTVPDLQMALISLAGFALFVYLFSKFKDTKPAVAYFLLIGASIILAQFLAGTHAARGRCRASP